MSIKAVTWAFEQRGLDPTSKLTLVALCDVHNGHTGQCNPRISILADMVGVSRRTVERHLSILRDRGLIAWENVQGRSGQSSNVYTLRQFDAPPCDTRVAPPTTPVSHTPTTPVSHPLTSIRPEPEIEPEGSEKPPFDDIVSLYHELAPNLPRVLKLTDKRKTAIRARHKDTFSQDLDQWAGYFRRAGTLAFLHGANGRGWTADIDFLLKPETPIKVLEGRYA